MKVELIASTFLHSCAIVESTGFQVDGMAQSGESLAEFAGRACYASWSRPNPETATNAGYLRNILKQGHFSVLEHASATFWITGVSRALTHELVRHRHLSFSQESQRYVPQNRVASTAIIPNVIREDEASMIAFLNARNAAYTGYRALIDRLAERFGSDTTAAKKAARQAARYVLPNATETKIVVTGNYRAWRHFVALRATEGADVEIRALAIEILKQLQRIAPNAFGDFEIENGTASSPYVERG